MEWNPIADEVEATQDVGHFVAQHKTGILIGAGIVLGVAAAATGVGAVIEAAGIASAVAAGSSVAEASTGAIVAGLTASAAGSAATYLDSGACRAGNSAACFGRDLGAIGAVTGSIATLGSGGLAAGLWELESLPDAIFQGLGHSRQYSELPRQCLTLRLRLQVPRPHVGRRLRRPNAGGRPKQIQMVAPW